MEVVPGSDTPLPHLATSRQGHHASNPFRRYSCLLPPRSTFLRVSGLLREPRPTGPPGNAPAG